MIINTNGVNTKDDIVTTVLKGFSKTTDTGDIKATDTLKVALNKLSNNIQIVYGVATTIASSTTTINLNITPDFVIVMDYYTGSKASILQSTILVNGDTDKRVTRYLNSSSDDLNGSLSGSTMTFTGASTSKTLKYIAFKV